MAVYSHRLFRDNNNIPHHEVYELGSKDNKQLYKDKEIVSTKAMRLKGIACIALTYIDNGLKRTDILWKDKETDDEHK